VEDAAIAECMIAMGVDYAQGYGVGRPEPLDMLPRPAIHGVAERG